MRPGLVATAVLLLLGAIAPSAFAQPPPDGQATDRFVTIVARECPEYTDITANRARNDIQESLRDLGDDTSYVAGQAIDPAIEARDQPNPPCVPITGWRFTLGTGIMERAVSGPWGRLSIVTDPFDTSIVTEDEVPLWDFSGGPTEDTIEGAVTIELTEDQAELAAEASQLWIQGGTPADPILNEEFPDQFGLGALRCAVDNLNGDNVEYISYPEGTEHVFCFAYYVRPPPTAGTIVIRKEVSDPAGATETFNFDGNLSFNEGGRFDLTVEDGAAAESQPFYRAATAGGEPWTVREDVPDGWTLEDLSCDSRTGESTDEIDRAAATVAINLAAGDRVTCTFTNAHRVPAGQLFIRKITRNGIGTFDFDVFPESGGEARSAQATTTEPGLAADAVPSPLDVSPGTYTIRETLPRRRGGRWRLVSARCAGKALRRRSTRSVSVTIGDQQGKACTFVNRFVPNGRIVIDKVTTGGVGTFGFLISPRSDPERVYEQSATTEEPGRLSRARGDRLRRLRLGRYVIQELAPDEDDGTWSLRLVICDGRVVPAVEGRVTIRLTARDPVKRCGFLNVFDPADGPGPVPPGPGPPGPNPVPGGPDPDLVVTKGADRPVAGIGERVAYTVTVRNRGPVAAEQVVLAEGSERGMAIASIRGRAGRRCGRVTNLRRPVGPVVVCRIGDLAAGASRTLRFETRLTQAARGRLTNVAVVGSETPETDVRNNVAASRIRVRRIVPTPVTG